MHKFTLFIFNFFKNSIQFFKILLIFNLMMLILYWIQNLTGIFWNWSRFMNPLLDFYLEIGNYVCPGKFEIFDTVFEYKYFIASLILMIVYYLAHLSYIILQKFEELYLDGRRAVNKIQENCYNISMEKQQIKEQEKIRMYQIYISLIKKTTVAFREQQVDLEEQNKILIKHLINKTNIQPQNFEDGFLFTFNNFSDIDEILDIFSKLPESKAPVDYIICLQIINTDPKNEIKQLKALINLKIINKIITMSDTAYRYTFNKECKYELSQLGIYQKEGGTYEVQEFIRKN